MLMLLNSMIGHVKHVQKALDAGVDIICAQGGEGKHLYARGSFLVTRRVQVEDSKLASLPVGQLNARTFLSTGDISSMILWPSCLHAIKGKTSPLTGKPIQLVAAGGIHNGRGVAAALSMGCSAVWIGTAFVVAEEAGASAAHQKEIISGRSPSGHEAEAADVFLIAGYDDTIRVSPLLG